MRASWTDAGPRSMLYSAPARAVLRVQDYARAKQFYNNVLGLPVDDMPGGLAEGIVMAGDGSQIELRERPGIPAPANTVLTFHAVDFDATIADLRQRGVSFMDLDKPDNGVRTENGVATVGAMRIAWFKDSEGNILSVATM